MLLEVKHIKKVFKTRFSKEETTALADFDFSVEEGVKFYFQAATLQLLKTKISQLFVVSILALSSKISISWIHYL